MDLASRVAYYLGNASCPSRAGHGRVPEAQVSLHHAIRYTCHGGPYPGLPPFYVSDLERACRISGRRRLRAWVGDLSNADDPPDSLTVTKARFVADRCGVLLPLNTQRHWALPSPDRLRDTSWDAKREAVVWRGSTTGTGLRRAFVHRLSSRHDVRFTSVVQGKAEWILNASHLDVRSWSERDLLRHKYILMLPGNDVATGLKWVMLSNSVLLMPTPEKETWLMEGLLRPWRHFVPVETPDDVDRALAWLRSHDDEARAITRNANAWVGSIARDLWGPVAKVLDGVARRGA